MHWQKKLQEIFRKKELGIGGRLILEESKRNGMKCCGLHLLTFEKVVDDRLINLISAKCKPLVSSLCSD
jgi:hypothetical protein